MQGGTPSGFSDPPREYSRGYRTCGRCAGRVAVSDTLQPNAPRLPGSLGAVALVAIVVVGLRQAPESKTPSEPKLSTISRARSCSAKLDGAPPALAALHRQANDLLPGARKGLQARVRALRGHPRGGQRLGRVVRAVPRRAARLPARVAATTASASPSSASTSSDNRDAAAQAPARHPADLPVLRGPRRQGRPTATASSARRARSSTTPRASRPTSTRASTSIARSSTPTSSATRRRDRGPAARAIRPRSTPRWRCATTSSASSRASASRRSSTGATARRCTSSSSTTARSSAPAACWPTGAEVKLGRMAVAPSHRGRGLAAALLAEADVRGPRARRDGASRSRPSSPRRRSTSAPATRRTATSSSTPASST